MAAATPAPRVTFYFGLKRPEASAAAAFFAVSQPGSPSYRRFLSLNQVAARYGASRATRSAFERAIARLGLSAQIDPSGVFARVSGTVSQLDRAFKVRIQRTFGNFPNVNTYALSGNGRLNLPAGLRSLVQDVVPTFAHSATATGAADGTREHRARQAAATHRHLGSRLRAGQSHRRVQLRSGTARVRDRPARKRSRRISGDLQPGRRRLARGHHR